MAKEKIILIDDEPDFVQNVKSYFEMFNYTCLSACNGQEGLKIIETEKPRLMILDILMPNMDGYTMLRELKRRKINIPCIIITAKGKLKDLFELEKVDRFITKPFELKKLKEVVDEMLGNLEKTQAAKDAGGNDVQTAGKSILVVDDEQRLAESIKNYLELKGYQVHAVFNGEEGLKAATTHKPDLIIADILMPRMDGYSMIKELRKENRETPIIVTTAKDKLKDFIAIEGVDVFITKPFDLSFLESKVKEIFGKVSS